MNEKEGEEGDISFISERITRSTRRKNEGGYISFISVLY